MAEDDDLDLDLDVVVEPDDADDDPQGKPPPSPQGTQDDDDVDQGDDQGDDQIDAGSQDRPEQRPLSRVERRIGALLENNRQKDQQLAQLNQRLDAILSTRSSQPQGESREQRDARRQQMSPEDRMYDVLSEHTEAWGREKLVLQAGMADQMDKAAFEAKCSVDKAYARRQKAVEAKLTELRSNGQSAPREAVLRWVIGDEALKAAGSKEVQTQRKDAAQRVRKQTVRTPANANGTGSDVRAERGRQTSRERRLENVQI